MSTLLKMKSLHPNAVAPAFAHNGDACFDLVATSVNGSTDPAGAKLQHGSPVLCGIGIAFAIPSGYVMKIYSRSGQGFNSDVRLCNNTGIIDQGYRGEVMVKLTRDFNQARANAPDLFIKPGDKVAQAKLEKLEETQFEWVDELPDSSRGTGGFGSTDKK